MKKEVQLPTGIAKINRTNIGASIEIDGFRATLRELQTLEMLNRGLSMDQISGELGISRNTVKTNVNSLVMRNTPDSSDSRPSVKQLIDMASHHGILNRISIVGIESVAEELKAQSPVRQERVRVAEVSKVETKPRRENLSLFVIVPNRDRLLAFAEERLDILLTCGHGQKYSENEALKIRNFVLLLLQGQSIPKSEITQSGLDVGFISRHAVHILSEFGDSQQQLRKMARRNFQ
jgi:hypothetical protein